MAENKHDASTTTQNVGDPKTPDHGAPIEAAPDSQERDHELFAQQSEPHDPEIVAPVVTPEPASATPGRKRGGYWQKFTLLLAILGLTATGVGIAAIKFKDKDERLRAISETIDAAAKDPEGFASALETKLADLWGQATATVANDRKPNPRQNAANDAAPPPVAPKPAAEPNPPPVIETPQSGPKPGWASPQESKPAPIAKDDHLAPVAAPAPASPPAMRGEDSAQVGALVKRIEQLEATTREALEAAKDAQRAAKLPEAGEKTAAPTADEGTYLNALEGRIDELADEIRKVREQLDQPKSETRVAPDAGETAASTQVKAITAAETLTLVQSLLHALERGRPFSAEQAALSERGVDPQLLAALVPVADQGAPTAAQLLVSFAPVAKRLRALDDAPPAGGSLTGHLLHEAGKLVRVRPVTEPTMVSITELVARIETTLAHDDLDGASQAFAKLPDSARNEAKAFGEALNQRLAAEQAAASLLANALAGLARVKN